MTSHPDIPSLKPQQIIRALEKGGLVFVRQKGSHRLYRHPDTKRRTTVTMHTHEVTSSWVKEIIKQAGISVHEFLDLLRE